MLEPDVEARRMFVRERRADLAHDAFRTERPVPFESRITRRRRRLKLWGHRFQVRAARPES